MARVWILLSIMTWVVGGVSAWAMGRPPLPAAQPLPSEFIAGIPFDIAADGLCFRNTDISSGNPPFVAWGRQTGVCQGMVGTARALYEHARFECEPRGGRTMTREEVRTAIQRARRLQAAGCRGNRYVFNISGFCSFRELCQAHRDVVESEVVNANSEIAFNYLFRDIDLLWAGTTATTGARNIETLRFLMKELTRGRPALMHYPFHVVMVTRVKIEWNADSKTPQAVLKVYDPNHPDAIQDWTIQLNSSLTETVGYTPIFPLLPEPSVELAKCNEI